MTSQLKIGNNYYNGTGNNYYNGTDCYCDKYGRIHREDGPAMIYANGTEVWYSDGKVHRTDGPAMVTQKSEGGVELAWLIHGIRYDFDKWFEYVHGKGSTGILR
jgi:hypothetical protein